MKNQIVVIRVRLAGWIIRWDNPSKVPVYLQAYDKKPAMFTWVGSEQKALVINRFADVELIVGKIEASSPFINQ